MTTPTQDLCERLEEDANEVQANYSSPIGDRIAQACEALKAQAARIAELESGLRGLSGMYAFAWDSTDGCLWMSPEGTARYESAHKEARRLLGEELMEVGEDGELVPEHEEYRELKARIASLEAKLRERGEPVAMRDPNYVGGVKLLRDVPPQTPLYAHPPAAAASDEVIHMAFENCANICDAVANQLRHVGSEGEAASLCAKRIRAALTAKEKGK
jgi:hypothetical protein